MSSSRDRRPPTPTERRLSREAWGSALASAERLTLDEAILDELMGICREQRHVALLLEQVIAGQRLMLTQLLRQTGSFQRLEIWLSTVADYPLSQAEVPTEVRQAADRLTVNGEVH